MNSSIDPLVWEQAADWCERRDELDDTAQASLQAWLATSERHRSAYEFLCAQIDSDELEMALAQVPRHPLATPLRQTVRLSARALPPAANDARRHGRRVVLGAGAAAVALLAVALMWRMAPGTEPADRHRTDLQEVASLRGAPMEIQTPDGSRVRLNADTRLAYRMTGRERQVELSQGEAYFDVAHDDHKPFVIDAGHTRVEVLGTAFDVNRVNDRVQVTVYRGRVQVSAADHVQLGVGDSVWVDGNTLEPVTHVDDVGYQADWMQGWMQVSDQPLAEVVTQLQRYLPQTIVLTDAAAGRQHVSGRFPLTQPRQSLTLLGQLGGLRLQEHNDQLVLSR